MPLSAGEKLGPYLILEKIGAGGMGEVYRARDERLGRDVALKVSAERFNERFEREARLIASLNHHNICSLFDVGPNFLVMELIDGPTLAERIADGPIPLEESLQIAAQIAEALQAAHESGIVHRDLKPGNIKVRPDGTVRVLDFGLAKMGSADPVSSSPFDSPTMHTAATQAGIIMGTAAYMSPEQARGKPVDKRADIWAFGAVLYEMLTGRKLFLGEDISQTLASVIMTEPDLAAVPPQVRHVLKRCLEKDPNKRLRDISGVALLLEHAPAVTPSTVKEKPAASRLWLIATVAVVVMAAALGGGWYRSLHAETPLQPLLRLNVDLGPKAIFSSSSISGSNAILSPDGRRLAYISNSKLFVQALDQPKAIELPGTSGAFGAFFSPNGQSLGFFSGGRMKKIAIDGGTAVTLGDVTLGRGGAWANDGYIIASLGATGVLSRIPEDGGKPVPVTELNAGELTHRWPSLSPGGKAVVYTAHTGANGFDTANIKLKMLPDGPTKTIQQGGTAGRIVQTPRGKAYLLYLSRGTLFAKAFDLDAMAVTGNAIPIQDGIGSTPGGAVEFDVSSEGTAIYRSTGGGLLTLQWMDPTGKMEPLVKAAGVYGRPSLSPAGDRVALEISDSSGTDIAIYEPRRENMSRLTFGGQNAGPVWSPDASYVVFQSPGGLSWVRADGGTAQPLVKSGGFDFPSSFTSDGKRLSYMERGKGGYDIWTVSIEGNITSGITAGTPEVFLDSDADERSPAFSADGHWLAYSSNESGTFETYVRTFPHSEAKWQVSSGGGTYVKWSPAHELVFETTDALIMSAAYSFKGNSFVSEKPRPWSPKPLANLVNSVRNFDLARDGKRIAALMPAETPEEDGSQSRVIFLLHFFDELERRVPAKK